MLPKAPEENNKVNKIVFGNGKDAKLIRDLQAKVYNIEKILE